MVKVQDLSNILHIKMSFLNKGWDSSLDAKSQLLKINSHFGVHSGGAEESLVFLETCEDFAYS